jgi:hypothetical protein
LLISSAFRFHDFLLVANRDLLFTDSNGLMIS